MYGYGFEVAKHSLAEYFGLLGAVNGIWSKLNLDDVGSTNAYDAIR